ncbi:DNA-binding protein [Devosia sediminis]|uniref:DNA-binding protein n=1 Tax=Devosia sediminis TaxID=2798801 RepID=A0A934MIN1_9HYPH|nr:DNA-binding protein [Devosia sediminis]MBJ3786392.1 DNA-binding protein [Devosia sediminis]
MSAAKATIENVREAILMLQRNNEKPTISKVSKYIGGGSRTTVLALMQQVFEETASAKPKSHMAQAYLIKLASGLVDEIWRNATKLANNDMKHRVDTLIDLNAGISDGMQELIEENASLLARAEAAEDRALQAEAQKAGRNEMDDHLSQLTKLITKLGPGDPEDPAMFSVIQMVADLETAPDRDEVRRRMLAKGFSSDAANRARYHAVHDDYVEERGETPRLYLTPRGRARLAKENLNTPPELGDTA